MLIIITSSNYYYFTEKNELNIEEMDTLAASTSQKESTTINTSDIITDNITDSPSLPLLEYETQIFLDLLHADGLVVTARLVWGLVSCTLK